MKVYNLITHPNTEEGIKKAFKSKEAFLKCEKPFKAFDEEVGGAMNELGYCFGFATEDDIDIQTVIGFLLDHGFGHPKIFQI